ncbi:MAG TPA: bifunctional diaminohydroxyphosphoribosylaminopyrimidine deaminase/5-amino-6-(5-phosphoribosylamino)uracil reductase RibD [Candidatus Binataceae bacterium]|nr:bifunctional diaminohydroxyphosphoribosylaminopyrimidine deaminase/5-amino-6-(5-phosphoribosylamino)uracil reductase RibD [Candidatus Binataceae bacterium]
MAAAPASSADLRFMRSALALARRMLGRTSPNPAVGCVIVRGGRIVGQGATAAGGRPHAEAVALARAGARARGATAYVSLEPCAHQGRTAPCARALVEAGVRRVVAGCVDPYPPVRGRGIAILRAAGVAVTSGVLEDECRRLNAGFITRVTRGRPFATLKLALSLDGRITAASGDSQWISSPASRALVHRWRREADAVMVGAGTVIADNPRLTCRVAGGRDPVRVIIDGRLRCPPRARVFVERSVAPALLVTTAANVARARRRYGGARVEVLGCPVRGGARGNEIDLRALMRELGRRGWCNVLVEGGARLAGSALGAGIIDRVAFFVAPIVIGAGTPAVEGLGFARVRDAIALDDLSVRRLGGDLLVEADIATRRRAPARRV